jgi:hypothetical protein
MNRSSAASCDRGVPLHCVMGAGSGRIGISAFNPLWECGMSADSSKHARVRHESKCAAHVIGVPLHCVMGAGSGRIGISAFKPLPRVRGSTPATVDASGTGFHSISCCRNDAEHAWVYHDVTQTPKPFPLQKAATVLLP